MALSEVGCQLSVDDQPNVRQSPSQIVHPPRLTLSSDTGDSLMSPVKIKHHSCADLYFFHTSKFTIYLQGIFPHKKALYPTHFANIICRNYSTGKFSLFYSAQKIFACKMHKLSVIFTSLLHPCFRD